MSSYMEMLIEFIFTMKEKLRVINENSYNSFALKVGTYIIQLYKVLGKISSVVALCYLFLVLISLWSSFGRFLLWKLEKSHFVLWYFFLNFISLILVDILMNHKIKIQSWTLTIVLYCNRMLFFCFLKCVIFSL